MRAEHLKGWLAASKRGQREASEKGGGNTVGEKGGTNRTTLGEPHGVDSDRDSRRGGGRITWGGPANSTGVMAKT